MARDSDDYEKFLHELIDNLNSYGRDVTDLSYGNKNVLKGASGQPHQIDVSFIDKSFDEPTLVLIECKCWENPVDVSVPKVLHYNIQDLSKSKDFPDKVIGIIVSTSRFNKGTIRLAEYEGIYVQKVNHREPYCFSYENIFQTGELAEVRVAEHLQLYENGRQILEIKIG